MLDCRQDQLIGTSSCAYQMVECGNGRKSTQHGSTPYHPPSVSIKQTFAEAIYQSTVYVFHIWPKKHCISIHGRTRDRVGRRYRRKMKMLSASGSLCTPFASRRCMPMLSYIGKHLLSDEYILWYDCRWIWMTYIACHNLLKKTSLLGVI